MKIIFIHDHKFKFNSENLYYTDGKFTNYVFSNYISSSEDVLDVVARRIKVEDKIENYNLVDHPQVNFFCVKGIKPFEIFFLNIFENFKLLKKVLSSDVNIMRFPAFLSLITAFICIFFGKKYFVEVVGHTKLSLIDANSGFFKKTFAWIYSFFTKIAIRNATGAIYVTKEYLQRDYPCFGITEYCSDVILDIKDNVCPKKSYIIKDIPNIGLIGSFNNGYKGIDFAIKIISELKLKNEQIVHLHILGHGSLLVQYQKLVRELKLEDQIFFDGLLPLEQVPVWLDQMDIYIQPSLTEGLPRSLIEAMSRGLPCIASDVGGIPELLVSEYTFNKFDERYVTKLIKDLLIDESLRKSAGQDNFIKSLEYSFDKLENKRRQFWINSKNISMNTQ